ncbi:MAG: hypothetical protein Q8N26_14820 [Myxococcales bacterium]|nr:hypothetical protein [Myxococcales bacterium]
MPTPPDAWNDDFLDLTDALLAADVEFLVVGASGVTFDEAWAGRVTKEVFGRHIPFIGVEALRRNKLASGRPKDLADAAWLDSAFPPTTR